MAIPVAWVEFGNTIGGNCEVLLVHSAPPGWLALTWRSAWSVVKISNGVGRKVVLVSIESAYALVSSEGAISRSSSPHAPLLHPPVKS